MSELFGRLDYAQMAPIGFRLIEKGAITLFGTSEYALRLFPLVSSLAALPLFWVTARHILAGWAATYAVGLFALGMPFIFLAQQVKQYSSDVTAAIVILLMVFHVRERGVTTRRAWTIGAAGAVIAWCSQPAVFVLAAGGIALLAMVVERRDWRAARTLAITGTLWTAGTAGAALHALRHVSDSDLQYFRWFWSGGFMPFPPTTPGEAVWVINKLTWAFGAFAADLSRAGGGLNYRWSWVFTSVCLLGLWTLLRRHRVAGITISLSMLLAAALSAAEIYPFTARLFAFLLPGLLIATAAGAERLLSIWPARLRALSPVALALLGGAPVYAAATSLPPYRPQHTRPLIEHLAERYTPGDAVYIYYGAGQAFRYYQGRGLISLPSQEVLMGRCETESPRAYLQQLDPLRGRSGVWVLVSTTAATGSPAALIVAYLDRIGARRETLLMAGTQGHPVEAAMLYRYDLSDRARLATASVETFPVGPGLGGAADRQWQCWGVGIPDGERK